MKSERKEAKSRRSKKFGLTSCLWGNVCAPHEQTLGFNFTLLLTAATAQRKNTRLPNCRCTHNPIRGQISSDFEMFKLFRHIFWSDFKKEERSMFGIQEAVFWLACDWCKMEDRRWEIPDSCPDVYKSPSPWILLRLTTIISAGMGQNGIWRGGKDEMGEGNGRGGRKWERGSSSD